MIPFLYLAIKSLYWSNVKTLKKFCGVMMRILSHTLLRGRKYLTYKNMHNQMMDEDFPEISNQLQEHSFFEFGSKEDHFKYRDAVMKAYPYAHFPVFENDEHMQLQIRNPKKFAEILDSIIQTDTFTF